MNKGMVVSVIFALMHSSSVFAQDFEYHPILSDNLIISLGAFKSNNSFKISAEGDLGDGIEDEINFGKAIGVDESTTLFYGLMRWKFGKTRKWSLFGGYFDADSSGEAVLTEDVEWQDFIYKEGSFVGAGVGIAVTRVFIGRSFVKNQQHDFGVGVGIHNLDLNAFIEGEVSIDDATTDFRRGDASSNQPLPNVGIWYNYSPARKWLIHARVDWISASIDEYDGSLWNTAVGVNYQAFPHVGFDLAFTYFDLNLNVDKSVWQGGIDMSYSGPVFSVTTNW